MSQIPEVNPAASPVGAEAVLPTRRGTLPHGATVPWAPTGVIMAVTFALLQLLNEVGLLMVIPLYGSMIKELGLTPSTVTWTLLASTIASAATLGLIVRLADNYGPKRLLIITIITITIGFVLSAVAPNATVLIIGRVLVGITAAPALCVALLNNRLAQADQKKAIGIITGGLAIAVTAGFVLGGLLAQLGASWRGAFWGAAALTAIALIGFIWIPEADTSTRKTASLDVVGVILLGVGLTAFAVGLSEAPTWGWTDARTLILVIGAVVVAVLWVLWELRQTDPLVDPRLIINRRLLPAFGSMAVIGFTAFFLYQLVATYATAVHSVAGYGFGYGAIAAGLVLLPVTIGGLITSRTTPILLAKYGPRVPLISGAVVFSLGFAWLWAFHSEVWQYEVGIMLFGLSVTQVITVSLAILTAESPKGRAASVSGIYLVLSTSAVSIGTAVYAAVMASGARAGSPFVAVGTFNLAYAVVFIASLFGIVFAVLLSKDSAVRPDAAPIH